MNEPFFSIVIPVYNVEKYLAYCVESVLRQNCSDYEVILVDDGSTDSSGNICEKYSQEFSFIKVIHKTNGGLSDARNCGVKSASGEYVLFVDSDDYISVDSLMEIKRIISETDYPDLICLECSKFYDEDNHFEPMNDGITSTINSLSGDKLYYYIGALNKFPASACTKAINREFLLENDLFFEIGKLSEDLEWSMRLFCYVKKVSYCEASYYNYRQSRKGSISTSAAEKNMFHIIDTVQEGYNLANTVDSLAKKKMLYSFIEYTYRLLILGYGKVEAPNRNFYKKQLKKNDTALGTRKDKASVIIRITYKLLGVNLTSKMMKKYLRIR